MTLFALLCGVAVFVPIEISHLLIGLFWLIAISVLLMGIIMGRGDRRAFSIGAFVVVSSVWTDLGGRFMLGVHYFYDILSLGQGVPLAAMLWLDLAVLAGTAVGIGWLCLRARAFFKAE